MSVEIYGLYDPDTQELRYVGKAKNSAKRLKAHLLERSLSRPVNLWIRALVACGKAPQMLVLEVVADSEWEAAERRLIAQHRQTSRLLNLADGGAMPSQTKEQRKRAAKASNKAQKESHPAIQNIRKANLELSKLHGHFMRKGYFSQAYKLKFTMRCYAEVPEYLSPASWLTL